MVAHRTAPTDRTCRHCGVDERTGARFKRWSLVCNVCRNSLRRAQHMSRDAAPDPPPPPLTPATLTPIRYVRAKLGRCPSLDQDARAARTYYAAVARVARELGYQEQAAEWAALAGGGDGD